MLVNLTDEERKAVGFAVACYLDDHEKRIKREQLRQRGDTTLAWKQFHTIEKLCYTKIIPEAWGGPPNPNWPS